MRQRFRTRCSEDRRAWPLLHRSLADWPSTIAMDDDTNDVSMIEPESLDLYTVKEIKHAVRGFPEASESPNDLNEFRAGKHQAYSAVMAMLTRFEETIEETGPTEAELAEAYQNNADASEGSENQ